MPSKRRHTRTAQLQPQAAAQSDNDTDTAAVTDSAAPVLAPPPPQRSDTELNFTVLRRYVPELAAIICIAPFAVLYTFSPETQLWEKAGTEGTLFVCQLTSQAGRPRYNVVILNRKSLENFITELVSSDDVDITEEYVILQVPGDDGTPQIFGIWLFSDETQPSTREMVAHTIQSYAMQAQIARESAAQVETTNGHEEDHTGEIDEDARLDDGGMEHEPAQPPQPPPVDLFELLRGPSKPIDASSQVAEPPPERMQPAPVAAHPGNFPMSADTEFFRGSYSLIPPEHRPQQPTPAILAQQNALLNLFKR